MKKIILTILIFILVAGAGIGVIQAYKSKLENSISENTAKLEDVSGLMVGSTRPIAGSTYTLAGSGITSSGASITLQSLTIPQNRYEIQDSDLSDTFYITLEPGSTKRQEIVSCTTATQNANDTATLSGCTRGLSPITPFTASTTLRFAHAGGTQVIFSDPPQLFNEYVSLANDETITSKKLFDVFPEFSDGTTPTTTNQFATKGYTDNLVNQGASTSTEAMAGISELATRVESASSTQWGINDPHVQQSEHASSTPSDNAFTDGVVWDIWSENDGKLSQLWIDLTESFTFSGAQINSASSTNASTSMRHLIYDGTDSDALFRGANADTLHIHKLQESYITDYTPATSTGTTVAELFSETITGGDMGTEGVVRCRLSGRQYSDSSVQGGYIGVYFGEEHIATSTLIGQNIAENYTFNATLDIRNRGASNLQWATLETIQGQPQQTIGATTTEMAIDTSSDQIVSILGVNAHGDNRISIVAGDCQLYK